MVARLISPLLAAYTLQPHAGLRSADGPVMCLGDLVSNVFRAKRPEQGDALGRGERQVVTGAPSSGQSGAEVVARGGYASQQIPECFGIDLSNESELFRRHAAPLPWGLAPTEVVIVHTVGHLVEVVVGPARGTESSDRQHQRRGREADGDSSMVE